MEGSIATVFQILEAHQYKMLTAIKYWVLNIKIWLEVKHKLNTGYQIFEGYLTSKSAVGYSEEDLPRQIDFSLR